MMNMGNLYSYLQGIQSLLAPAMVAVFTLGIFSKKITPKAGEWGLIGGFIVGMLRLLTNVITDSGEQLCKVHSGIVQHGSGRQTGLSSSAGFLYSLSR
jgi:hypothetical protein